MVAGGTRRPGAGATASTSGCAVFRRLTASSTGPAHTRRAGDVPPRPRPDELRCGEPRGALPALLHPGSGIRPPWVFRPILLDVDRDGCFDRRSRRSRGDLADVGLQGILNGFRHLVEQVGGLVQPAPLVAGGGQNLVERLPETEGAVVDRDLGRDGEAFLRQPSPKVPHSSDLPRLLSPIVVTRTTPRLWNRRRWIKSRIDPAER